VHPPTVEPQLFLDLLTELGSQVFHHSDTPEENTSKLSLIRCYR
jgi:hypothetical protein